MNNHEKKDFVKLWAPWRMQYIEGIDTEKSEKCIFCDYPEKNDDIKHFILCRGKLCFVILNIFPYNNGHLLIVPYKHTAEFENLNEKTRLELMNMTGIAIDAVKKTMRPDGFNIGMNLGRSAGAGIADHIHMHIVPRWNGDTNFMPVIGGTKVISESLEDTYMKLREAIDSCLKRLSKPKQHKKSKTI
jgi:ATP adenylyltransferase